MIIHKKLVYSRRNENLILNILLRKVMMVIDLTIFVTNI